jgi:RNA polymerase sigma-70 factor (ECF subfamily)
MMGVDMTDDVREPDELQSLRQGGAAALGELFARHRDRLRLAVSLRLDRRLQGRVDPSDVLQEAFLEAAGRLDGYLARPALPPYLWLRFLATQRLLITHRQHLQTQARDAGRELSLDQPAGPEVSSENLAAWLLASGTSPSQALLRAERQAWLQEALAGMEAADREVLVLRHFEELSNAEAAQVLGVQPGAASQRYYRALKRLRAVLAALPGGLPEA